MSHSEAFGRLMRQVARRRRDLLRGATGRDYIFPQSGELWLPSHREQALCEMFVVLFVAELETYLEAVVNTAMDSFEERMLVSGLHHCTGATEFIAKIVDKRQRWQKNNNTNWKRVEEYFVFVGLDKSKFPDGTWDSIDAVVSHRGDIVHNSLGVRAILDPRITIDQISIVLAKLALFDSDWMNWHDRASADRDRAHSVELGFIAGLGRISTAALT